MKLKHRCVIFDLDGTLVDTLGDIAASMNRSLKLHLFPELRTEEYKEKVGWGIRRLAYLSLPESARKDETVAAVAADAARFYAENPLGHSRPYPGIPALLGALRQMKVKAAVITNKPDPAAQLIIGGLFPQDTFCHVQGEITGRPRKPDPACVWDLMVELNLNPADVIIAGDSEVDIETALASGCYPLGVAWGYRSREIIIDAGARRVIEKPEELLDLF